MIRGPVFEWLECALSCARYAVDCEDTGADGCARIETRYAARYGKADGTPADLDRAQIHMRHP